MIYTYDGIYTIVLYALLGATGAWLACGIFLVVALAVMALSNHQQQKHS